MININWLIWFRSKPWKYKWFIFLVLFRPIIDNFYHLKHVSALLSPLYIVGVLTPILALPVIISGYKKKNQIDTMFGLWSAIVMINIVFLLIYERDIVTFLQWSIKLTLPVVLFFYLRIFIRNRKDFEGLLITLLYSTFFTIGILLYEFLVNPISIQMSRGVERYEGGYADVMNYAIYISLGFLVGSYFFLTKGENTFKFKINLQKFVLVLFFCFLGLFAAKHSTTMGVIAGLLTFFLFYVLKKNKGYAFVLGLLLFIGYSFYGETLKEQTIDPMMERELEVLDGSRPETQMFHGRMTRWLYAIELYEKTGIISKLFGYIISFQSPYFHVGIAVHNDFLRIMFLSGIVGLIIYILFLFLVFRRTSNLPIYLRYLNRGFLIILLIYSVTTLPTFYASIMYLISASWAFMALPYEDQIKI